MLYHCSDGATELTDHALNDILAMTSQDMLPVGVGAEEHDDRLNSCSMQYNLNNYVLLTVDHS